MSAASRGVGRSRPAHTAGATCRATTASRAAAAAAGVVGWDRLGIAGQETAAARAPRSLCAADRHRLPHTPSPGAPPAPHPPAMTTPGAWLDAVLAMRGDRAPAYPPPARGAVRRHLADLVAVREERQWAVGGAAPDAGAGRHAATPPPSLPLQEFPTLVLKLDTYTYPDGRAVPLLVAEGTLPVYYLVRGRGKGRETALGRPLTLTRPHATQTFPNLPRASSTTFRWPCGSGRRTPRRPRRSTCGRRPT